MRTYTGPYNGPLPPMLIEEVVRAIEYVRCPVCAGARMQPHGLGRCPRCDGWGYVVDPPELAQRLELGLQALHGGFIEVHRKPKKRLVLPSRKKRHGSGGSGGGSPPG